jgi:hypothetical protein
MYCVEILGSEWIVKENILDILYTCSGEGHLENYPFVEKESLKSCGEANYSSDNIHSGMQGLGQISTQIIQTPLNKFSLSAYNKFLIIYFHVFIKKDKEFF